MKTIFEQLQEKGLKYRVDAKTYRGELIARLTKHLNAEREKQGYKPLTEKAVFFIVNKNPFLSGRKNDGELKALIDECLEKGHFKKFWWVVKQK